MLDFEYDPEEQAKLRRDGVTVDDYHPGTGRHIWDRGNLVEWWPFAGGVLYSYHPWERNLGSTRFGDSTVLLWGWYYDDSTFRDSLLHPLDALLDMVARGVEDDDEISAIGLNAVNRIQAYKGIRVRKFVG